MDAGELGELGRQAWARIVPGGAPESGWWIVLAIGLAVLMVVAPPLWRLARLAVTIVHELGHAGVGILTGRRFTGFVVSPDMSGHAVTVGRRRGIGRVLTTWAGYPAPALLGALLIQIALRGGAHTALVAAVAILLLSLVFTRTLHTVAAVLGTAAVLGAVWWWGGEALNALVALAAGAFLLLGAWRHLGAVTARGGRSDDPAQLGQLTPLPRWSWILGWVIVLGGCTWWSWAALAPRVSALL